MTTRTITATLLAACVVVAAASYLFATVWTLPVVIVVAFSLIDLSLRSFNRSFPEVGKDLSLLLSTALFLAITALAFAYSGAGLTGIHASNVMLLAVTTLMVTGVVLILCAFVRRTVDDALRRTR